VKLHKLLNKGPSVYQHEWGGMPPTLDIDSRPRRYSNKTNSYSYPTKTENIGPSVWEVEMRNNYVGKHLTFSDRDNQTVLHFSPRTAELLLKYIQSGKVEITSDGWLKLLVYPVIRGGAVFWAPWNK